MERHSESVKKEKTSGKKAAAFFPEVFWFTEDLQKLPLDDGD